MKKMFLLSITVCLSFLYSLDVWAQNCVIATDCAGLGYKYAKEECDSGAVKCPNGNGYYCATSHSQCVIGDIYYSDGSCSSVLVSSKTALGVVVYMTSDGKHGQIMSPQNIKKDGSAISNTDFNNVTALWSSENVNISGLPNYPDGIYAELDFDSCANTNKIVSAGNADKFPAAWATRKYAPTAETKGKWCLPGAGILKRVINNNTVFQEAFEKLNGKMLGCYTFSSSLGSGGRVWTYCSTSTLSDMKRNRSEYVRPVLEF